MIVFRKARAGDLEVIKGILQKVELEVDGIEQHIDNFMVVEEESRAIAVGGLEIYGDVAMLKCVAVLPEYRGRGIGDGLVRALINFAERRGVNTIYTYPGNATVFFERFGFAVAEPLDVKGPWTASSILMRLDVNDFFRNIKCRK
ncbi:MAG: GNAT family N-acetyltransferase [Bacillota bacterium]|nr:MAG: hypothetical protein DIU66_01035 [Bacillota bacterium]